MFISITPLAVHDVDTIRRIIEQSLDDDKAENITTINLAGKSSFADHMIIASGRSQRHVAALADHIVERLKAIGIEHASVEGKELCDWVLVDAGDVVAHLFRPEVRETYNLEKMWSVALPAAEAV